MSAKQTYVSFRAYTARRKAVEERRMSGNGLPDYAFSSDYEYRKRLDAIPHFYSVGKDDAGNTYSYVDEEMRNRLQVRLITRTKLRR